MLVEMGTRQATTGLVGAGCAWILSTRCTTIGLSIYETT